MKVAAFTAEARYSEGYIKFEGDQRVWDLVLLWPKVVNKLVVCTLRVGHWTRLKASFFVKVAASTMEARCSKGCTGYGRKP
jgi:hypothetical protein